MTVRTYLYTLTLVLSLLACTGDNSSNPDGHVYLRTLLWTNSYGTSLDISWLYLGDDGTLVRNPTGGVNPVDVAWERQHNAANTGTYTLEDNRMLITWANGQTVTWNVEYEGGDLSAVDGGLVTEPDALPDDYRLDGQYATSAVLPDVSGSQTLIFRPDGTFERSTLGTVHAGIASGQSASEAQGTYLISGNTLTLTMANGDVKKSIICTMAIYKDPSLVINSSHYPRER